MALLVLAVLTLGAALLAFDQRQRSIALRFEYPQMMLKDPARDLFFVAENARRDEQQHGFRPLSFFSMGECLLCTEQKVEAAFDDLLEERARYRLAGRRRTGGPTWLRHAEAARTVALASWGNSEQLAELHKLDLTDVPDYALDRARELLGGAPSNTESSSARFVWVLDLVRAGLILLAIYLGIAALRGWRYPRRPARCQLRAPTFWRGLMIFAWAEGAHSAIVHLYWDDPDGVFGFLVHGHSLTTMLIALLLVFAFRENPRDRPIAALFACPPDARSRRAIWQLGLASTGALMLAWRLAWPLFHHLGLAPGWWESYRESELFGTQGEAAFEVLSGAVFAPIGEELLFRGVLFGALTRKLSVNKAALISSLLFAAIHGYGILGTLDIVLCGFLWARIAARTGTLVPSMIGHSAMNTLLGVGRLLIRP